jgi:hypothetical protein
MSEDEDSPRHQWGEEEKLHAVIMAYKAYGNIMGLLEYDRHEEVSILLGQLGGA